MENDPPNPYILLLELAATRAERRLPPRHDIPTQSIEGRTNRC